MNPSLEVHVHSTQRYSDPGRPQVNAESGRKRKSSCKGSGLVGIEPSFEIARGSDARLNQLARRVEGASTPDVVLHPKSRASVPRPYAGNYSTSRYLISP